MNPQLSLWNTIAQKQKMIDIEREKQQRRLKNSIKFQYQKQLEDHLHLAKSAKMKEQQKQKEFERKIIDQSLSNQQKMLQINKAKADAINQKQRRIDMQNQYYRMLYKDKQKMTEQLIKKQQNQICYQNHQLHKKYIQENDKKKKQMMDYLKKSIQQKSMREKMKKSEQIKFENMKLMENEMLIERQRQDREQYLQRLKQKSKTIDYGSHYAFKRHHEKSQMERQKQERQNKQQYQRRARHLDQYENQLKKSKMFLQNEYKIELQKQIQQRQFNKKYQQRKQLEEDSENIRRYQNYSKSVDEYKKAQQDKSKKELINFLKKQMEYKSKLPNQANYISNREIQLNIDLLSNNQGMIPGQSFGLDPARKKQLQIIAKSFQHNSPTPQADKNYLAERGRTILY